MTNETPIQLSPRGRASFSSRLGAAVAVLLALTLLAYTIIGRADSPGEPLPNPVLHQLTTEHGPDGHQYAVLTFTRDRAGVDLDYTVETGPDLKTWVPFPPTETTELTVTPAADGQTETVRLRVNTPVSEAAK